MKIKKANFSIVASWQWDLGDNEECTICGIYFDSPCPDCKLPGDDCPPLEGKCSHIFHLHCINRWIESNKNNCPLCRDEWGVKLHQ